MISLSAKQKNILSIIGAGIIGVVVFVFIYSELFNPAYDAWLLASGPDIVQHYIGWIMYRQADWSFPLGLANNYAYPFGTPITYTDSIPILAFIFKVFRSFLPMTWQYTGLWIMICFVGQAIFGYLLLKTFIKQRTLALIGSVIFTLSPIMLFRLGGHFALGGHWLILAGIWLIIRASHKISWPAWTWLLLVSLLVHPYLLFMNALLFLAYLADLFLVRRLINIKKVFLFLFAEVLLIFLTGYIFGLFVIGDVAAGGYGDYSMNLNALVNPMSWSRLLPDLPMTQYQAEGFNYLGLGIIVLLILSLYKFLRQGKESWKIFWQKYWPLMIVSIILFLFAISNVVVLNSHTLLSLPLPKDIFWKFFGLLRSSGRFFWPVYYLLFLVAFYIIKNWKFKWAFLVLIVALFLQVYDLSSKLSNRGQEFVGKVWSNTAIANTLDLGVKDYHHMVFLPVIPHRVFPAFAVYATQHNLTISDGYFARPIRGLRAYTAQAIEDIKAGNLDKDTIYVFSREADVLMANIDLREHLVKEVDSTVILFPYFKK